MIKVSKVTVKFQEVTALKEVSTSFEAGQRTAIFGANGSGKTTLLKSISGLVKVTEGKIFYRGEEITHLSARERVLRGIQYIPDRARVAMNMTVEENLRIGGFTRKRIDVDSSMEEVFSLFPEISEKKAQPAGVLSGGERQMLVIGRAYISSPSIMLLDEPLLGLSKNMRARTLSLLMKMWERGITLIISEHDVDEIIAVTDRYLVFLNGELVGKGEVEGPQAAEKLKKAFKKFYKWGRNCG